MDGCHFTYRFHTEGLLTMSPSLQLADFCTFFPKRQQLAQSRVGHFMEFWYRDYCYHLSPGLVSHCKDGYKTYYFEQWKCVIYLNTRSSPSIFVYSVFAHFHTSCMPVWKTVFQTYLLIFSLTFKILYIERGISLKRLWKHSTEIDETFKSSVAILQ